MRFITKRMSFAACGAVLVVGFLLRGLVAQDPDDAKKIQDARETPDPIPLVTGRNITPAGTQTTVGSFPANMALSPDGKYFVVTNTGFRQFLSVLSVEDGHLVSQLEIGKTQKKGEKKEGLYYGLAFHSPIGTFHDPHLGALYVSCGAEEKVSVYRLDGAGRLTKERDLFVKSDVPGDKSPFHVAGIALASELTERLYVVNNHTGPFSDLKGELRLIEVGSGKTIGKVALPGFPFAVAAKRQGNVYVSSERDGVVSVVDTKATRVVKNIPTGDHPTTLLFNKRQTQLFVANSGSDSISVIDTTNDSVIRTIPLRPNDVRGLPGATPLGMCLAPGDRRLYVTLADMNAVAVVDVIEGKVLGYIPVGWYPTACVLSPEGFYLFVANAKGVTVRNPNGKPVGEWGQYIQNIIEGTVSTVPVPRPEQLEEQTRAVLVNNRLSPRMILANRQRPFLNPGIKHVIYIIKENRTYDQVLGDLPQGNGDKNLCLFPREVTPNQHALAERFGLLDNFYVCAEVSADGWDWSTSGMVSEYTARNAPYNYSGRGRNYDFEGDNNGVPVDLRGLPDVARASGGYIWDAVAKQGLTYRNYGFYLSFFGPADRGPEGKPLGISNTPNKKALVGHTDLDFLQFDMTYADSDAWLKLNAACPKQTKSYGKYNAPSRFREWKREFDKYVETGTLPSFSMLRLPRDHTSGTSVGLHTPRAMVADNDYAVGQIVEAVSHSPYWKSTAIFVLEDDAQDGNDHVDAHRSIAFVISPYTTRGTIDHRFYNTDTTLRTMEMLLGVPPMCQYDAIATPFPFIGGQPTNDEPYTAILPDKKIVGEVNTKTAYRAREMAKLNFKREDAVPDDLLTKVVWHSVKGAKTLMPPIRYGLRTHAERKDADGD